MFILKPGSHMSPMIGESFSVTIQGENSQRILLMSSHKQWSSPMSATYVADVGSSVSCMNGPITRNIHCMNSCEKAWSVLVIFLDSFSNKSYWFVLCQK